MRWTAADQRGGRALLLLLLSAALAGLTGCSPESFLSVDEGRERNLQRAQAAERMRDFEAAAEYYERALEKNPGSALVHLGFASLCETHLDRHAEAIYHYQRYLRLRPDDPKAETLRRRMTNCMERLATSVPVVIRSETIARDLEAVRRENASLRAQVTNLQSALLGWSNETVRVTQLLTTQTERANNLEAALTGGRALQPPGTVAESSTPRPGATPPGKRAATTPRGVTPLTAGSYKVQPRDTLSSIARRHGITLTALRRANPYLDERRLLPGTVVRIPAR